MSSDLSTTGSQQAGEAHAPASRIALAIGLVALVVVGLVAALSLASSTTAACSRCHAPQATALARSAHAGVDCTRCHFSSRGSVFSRIDVVTRMLPASIGGVGLTGPGRPVGSAACISCHPTWVAGGVVSKNGLRIDHTVCTVASPCENCHGETIHGTATRFVRRAEMADCVTCHTDSKAPIGCTTCHVGSLPDSGSGRGEFARTHGPDWETMHGTGELGSCAACHAPDACARCHGVSFPHPTSFGATHGKLALSSGEAACLTCHKNPAYCSGCHGIEMPHPVGFLQLHGGIATSVNDTGCARCHVLDDCAQCHDYHVHPGGTAPPVGRNGGG